MVGKDIENDWWILMVIVGKMLTCIDYYWLMVIYSGEDVVKGGETENRPFFSPRFSLRCWPPRIWDLQRSTLRSSVLEARHGVEPSTWINTLVVFLICFFNKVTLVLLISHLYYLYMLVFEVIWCYLVITLVFLQFVLYNIWKLDLIHHPYYIVISFWVTKGVTSRTFVSDWTTWRTILTDF